MLVLHIHPSKRSWAHFKKNSKIRKKLVGRERRGRYDVVVWTCLTTNTQDQGTGRDFEAHESISVWQKIKRFVRKLPHESVVAGQVSLSCLHTGVATFLAIPNCTTALPTIPNCTTASPTCNQEKLLSPVSKFRQ